MKNSGNIFSWLEVSAQHVLEREQEKKYIDQLRLINKQSGIKKILRYPSYEHVCLPYQPPHNMSRLEEQLIAETSLYATPGALECGYAQNINWTADGILNEEIYKWIGCYTRIRLELAGTCVEIGKNNAFKMRDFYQCIESSEKATISFILGGFFCFQSATYWLRSRNEEINLFIHAGLAMKASLEFPPKKTKRKMPDYLVGTDKDEWHIFESKGGEHTSRWQRIEEGVVQLGSVTHIVCNANPPQKFSTFVCTHTSIDAGDDIVINVVDPAPEKPESIIINRDVCLLLTKLTLISLFDTLSAIKTSRIQKIPGMDDWVFVHASEYDNINFGIPEMCLGYKRKLKLRLGIYLLIKEIIDLNLAKDKIGVSIAELKEKLTASLSSPVKLRRVIGVLSPFMRRKISHENYGDYFNALSEYLALPKLTVKILEEEKRLVNDLPGIIKKHRSPWGGLTRKAPLPGNDDPWALAHSNKQKKLRMKHKNR
ncbi:hypothetical protein [Enterobacter sp. ZOR0014]|uniref:hypothetical protein n=1 Tax=Enterobacter sp. ZOR0014 TaxID=1339232 RepID=UPI000645A6FA|nr:hypothetical protein [Enterobacter sp. ZOR0014]